MTKPGVTVASHVHMRRRLRQLLLVLVAVDVLAGLIIAAFWVLGLGPFRDDTMRGSTPPVGQYLPNLSTIGKITPKVPTATSLRGHAVALAVTCIDCSSGQVFGGFLGRMGVDGFPAGATLLTLTWNGDAKTWAGESHISKRWQRYSIAPLAPVDRIAHVLHVGTSGQVLLYDKRGRWRSTYQLGQLNVDDISHDLRVLENE